MAIAIKDILDFIYSSSCTALERQQIVGALNHQRKLENSKALYSFRVRERVKFTTSAGQTVVGTIAKLGRTNVQVTADNGARWRVSPSLLQRG